MKKFCAVLAAVILFVSFAVPFSVGATERDVTFETSLAADLKELGLFNGVSDTDFDLLRAPTRAEALTMLIRILGKEDEALSEKNAHPFTDVASWADDYIGYAYANGLANGVSDTQFGSSTASAAMYLTFVLRALGYSDANGDFAWDDPFELAQSVGILPDDVNIISFRRADVVTVSYAALASSLKGTNATLADKLIAEKAFTSETFTSCYDADVFVAEPTPAVKTELSPEEIYALCSPAVFYIEIYNAAGARLGSGSGFFIASSGIAVTNYHVIKSAASAKVTISSSGEVCDVTGIYDCSEEEDWAIIQISGEDFPYLTVNNTVPVGGATVYAIGSPQGLQNTISQGIISNPNRQINSATYIQTTAAISQGSSGGALLNKYGEVIGITSAYYNGGQNLNFARPISNIENADFSYADKIGNVIQLETVKYNVSANSVTVKAGEKATLTFTSEHVNIPEGEAVTYRLFSNDTNVATAFWTNSTTEQPWTISVYAKAAGTTTIAVINDRTSDILEITVTVE